MKKNWEIVRLGDLCESDLGKTLNKSHDTGNFHPYLCSINVLWDKIDLSTLKEARFNENEIEKYSVQKGDLLICEGGDIGRCAIWEKEESFLYQNAIHRVRFNDRINPRYCLYYLKHLKDTGTLDSRYGKGVTIKHLVKSSLHSIPIPVPPLPVQARIVDELDCLQGILSKKRQQLAEYHSLAQAIFHQMFGDPVVNEKGWEVKRLGEITNNLDSKRKPITKKDRKEGIYPYYGASGITDYVEGFIFDGNYLLVSEDGANLLTRTAPIAFLALGKIWINNHVHVMQCDNIASHTYIQYHLNQITLKKYISGSAQPKLNQEKLNSIPIPFPPLPLQQSFANRIAVINNQCESLNKSIHEMETLLATRMDKLLNMDC